MPSRLDNLISALKAFGINVVAAVGVNPPTPTPTPNPTPTPMPPANDAGSKASVLRMLNDIKGKHAISGQFVEKGPVQPLADIAASTGKYPAMVGFDCWWFNAPLTVSPDFGWIQAAKDHWNAGGLVSLSFSMPNPFTSGGIMDTNGVQFDKLLITGNSPNNNLNHMLDLIGQGLQPIKDKPLFFRYAHENNGGWFWYGHLNDEQFKAYWVYVRNYLMTKYNLTNLIWTNAQNAGGANPNRVAFGATDVVGVDGYTNNPAGLINDFNALRPLGLPMFLTEFGSGSPDKGDPNFELTTLIAALKGPLKDVVGWLNWWDGNGGNVGWGMAELKRVKEALNDPYVINRGEFTLS